MKVLKNRKAAMTIGSVILLGVALVMLAYLMPIGLLAIADANTTGWSAAVISIFQIVLPLVAVIGAALRFVPRKVG